MTDYFQICQNVSSLASDSTKKGELIKYLTSLNKREICFVTGLAWYGMDALGGCENIDKTPVRYFAEASAKYDKAHDAEYLASKGGALAKHLNEALVALTNRSLSEFVGESRSAGSHA